MTRVPDIFRKRVNWSLVVKNGLMPTILFNGVRRP